jgi:YVTN family beta-propeller protein
VAGARLARRFAEIVREEVQSAGGELLELRGDEALAVFKSPRLALRSAVALQARLDKETEAEPGLPLRVGIGLDVGEAVTFEGGYRGGALNLAARLCSLAGPGDVLASEGVIHLARKVEGLRYLDRRARLKGIAEPVRFVRVVPEEVGGDKQPRWRELASRRRKSAIRRPLLSRKQLWVIAALVVVAVAVPVSLILARGGGTLLHVGANAAGLIDTNQGRVLASVPVGGRPAGIAYYRGAIWVVNTVNGTVSRIDPRTESVEDSIEVGNSPSGLAAGQGALWVTNSEEGTVSEINPDANRVVQTIAVGNGPRGIIVGAGAVWVANSLDGTVSRIDPTAGAVTRTIPVGGTPSAVTVGGGAIWVASETTGAVSRIDPASGLYSRRSPSATDRPTSLSRQVRCGSRTASTVQSRASTRQRTPSLRRSTSETIQRQSPSAQTACGWRTRQGVHSSNSTHGRSASGERSPSAIARRPSS